jgi:hypothetical protein
MTRSASCPSADTMQVARLLVTDPRLVAYFHFERTERKGVQLRDRAMALGLTHAVELAPRITAMPGDATLLPGWIELSLDLTDCTDQRIELHWRLPAEGLSGSARFSRTADSWVLGQLSLVER